MRGRSVKESDSSDDEDPKPFSSTYERLPIVNWALINDIDPKLLKQTKDSKLMAKVLNNFMKATSLFADPSICPPHLVLKYFSILQIAVGDLITENNQLKKVIDNKNKEINRIKSPEHKRKRELKYNLPPIIFQCPFCVKKFKTQDFLEKHINKRHQKTKQQVSNSGVKTQQRQEQIIHKVEKAKIIHHEEMEPFKAEIQAILDRHDTIKKNEQIQMKMEYMQQIHKLESMIESLTNKVANGNIDEDNIPSFSTFSNASYSGIMSEYESTSEDTFSQDSEEIIHLSNNVSLEEEMEEEEEEEEEEETSTMN